MPGRTRVRTHPTVTGQAVFNRYTPYTETRVLGTYDQLSGSEVMQDWVTEGYFSRIKRGDVINNNMSYTKKTFSAGSGNAVYSAVSGNSSFAISGAVTAYRLSGAGVADIPGPPVSLFQDLVKEARSACIAAMNSATVATGEDIKEINKTVDLLRNPIRDISRNLHRIERDYKKRKSKKDKAMSFGKFLANYWVQYRFAFTPLARSIENILLEANKTVPPRYFQTERSHSRKYKEFRNSRTITAGDSVFRQDVSVTYKVHAYSIYRLSGASNFGNGRRWGSRLRDWPDRTWQVMPYSFMVDRLYNVSNIINGIVNLVDPNVSVISAGNTYKIETVRSTTYIADVNPAYTSSVSGETRTTTEYHYDRETWAPDIADVFPVPSVANLVNDATKVADLLSLITQKLIK